MIFRFGAYELDEHAGELRHRGEPVAIQPKPLALLLLLLQERDRVVPIDELLDRLWPDAIVSPGSLTRAVSTARKAIGDMNRAALLRSYARRGYRFCGDVVEIGDRGVGTAPAAGAPTAPAAPEVDAEALIGRDEALTALRSELDDALAGRGGLAFVTGPPGIGKTHLVESFAAELERRAVPAFVARAREGEGSPAFWVFAQLLRRLLRDETYAASFEGLGEAAGEIAALLPELGVAPSDEHEGEPAERRRFAFFDGVTRALEHCGHSRPLALVVEDAQWCGDASLRLLEHLAFELREARVLLIATIRDEPREASHPVERTLQLLRRQSHGRPVELERLSRGQVAELLERTLGRRSPADLTSELYARTEGVPLYLREALRLLAERGDLDRPETVARAGLSLPAERFDFLQRALDGLRDEVAALVEHAAVLGRDFSLGLVAELAGVARPRALDELTEAEQAGVVEPAPDDAATWRFSHALFQDAAYGRISVAQRTRLHQRAAELLEARHAAHPDAAVSELAHHLHRGLAVGDAEHAFRIARRAAARAQQLMDFEKAAAHLEQATAALEHLTPTDPARQLETLLELGETYKSGGERARRFEVMSAAMEIARALDRPEDFARAAIGFCDISEWSPTDPASEAIAREALEEAATRLPDEGQPEQARVLARRGFLAVLHGPERATPLCREAVERARRADDGLARQEALYTLHFTIGGPDHLEERATLAREMIEVAEETNALDTTVITLIDVASDCLELGDAAGARARRDEAERLAGARPHLAMTWHLQLYDAGTALMEGRLDEARAITEEAYVIGRRIAHPYARGCYNAHRVCIAHEQGDAETVERIFGPAIKHFLGPTHWIRAMLGRACLSAGRQDDARGHLEALASFGFDQIPRNLRWSNSLVAAAHLCADLESEEHARPLIDLLEGYEDHHGLMAVPVNYGGPLGFARARLLAFLGERREALEQLEAADAACLGLGARPTRARVAVAQGRLLASLGKRDAARERLSLAQRLGEDLGLPPVIEAAGAELAALGGAG